MGDECPRIVVETHLLNKKPRPHIDNHMLRVRELALDVQRVGQRDKDVLFSCAWWMARQRSCMHALDGSRGGVVDELSNPADPDCTTRRHSLNLACAAASCEYDPERCSTSSSSCFLTAVSCWGVRVSRETTGGC